MKRLLVAVLVVVSLIGLAGCGEGTTPIATPSATEDTEFRDYLGHRYKYDSAAKNGDTYCMLCEKITAGTVKICSYCGQYIKYPVRPAGR